MQDPLWYNSKETSNESKKINSIWRNLFTSQNHSPKMEFNSDSRVSFQDLMVWLRNRLQEKWRCLHKNGCGANTVNIGLQLKLMALTPFSFGSFHFTKTTPEKLTLYKVKSVIAERELTVTEIIWNTSCEYQ